MRLVRGGDPEPLAAAAGDMDRILCPFSRAQYGYRVLEEESRYQMVDFFVCAITCQHMRRVADIWDLNTDVEVFRIGVPHAYNTEAGLRYYLEMVKSLKEKLETFSGVKIEEERLKEAIILYNRLRELLKEISYLRKSKVPAITGRDFFKLMHSSFYLDPKEVVEILESLLVQLKENGNKKETGKHRILLTGNMLAVGDYKVIDMAEETGGAVVIEQFCGGVRHYLDNINQDGDLLEALARRYLQGRAPCAFMRPSRERIDLTVKLAKEFEVDGIIWYQLRYCETYNMEYFYFNNIMKEAGLPVLQLESEYDVEERGRLLNRVESFMESMERRA
ncbi:MAG: 2-hydroxyacyl-CoA dehydratase [Deltaproteobacteria bacterium]|nr:2-hydroxyacyl-CoA dehydratase [Deltaproteobacteria bacterium]